MSIVNEKKIILASSSPRRQELIALLRIPFEVKVSDVNEDTEPGLDPVQIVEQLSSRKAAAVCEMYKDRPEDGIVIGSDTIVALDGEVLGKPKDRQDAFRMLHALQGREHQVFTGVACIDLRTGQHIVSHQVTRVYMKPLTNGEIERYMDTGEPMDKAGAYGIQGIGATLIKGIEGDYFNVVGLPLALVSDLLLNFDIHVL